LEAAKTPMMEYHAVSNTVELPKNDTPELVEKIES
jgi:hypothetical protein